MPNLSLRGFDNAIWARAMTRAQIEGWSQRELIQALLSGYADGTIVPPGRPSRPPTVQREGVADLHFACPKCNRAMTVTVKAFEGFGAMTFQAIPCPHCQQTTERALPAECVSVSP